MSCINEVTLMGYVKDDPMTFDGKNLVIFSLRTTDKWKDKATGEERMADEWHNVVVWNEKLAEIVRKYVKKGQHIYIVGKIKSSTYTSNEGVERKKYDIVMNSPRHTLTFLGSSKKFNDDKPKDNPVLENYYNPKNSYAAPSAASELPDDDIPF
jgi:single-strand DNA-binding protein